MKTILYMRLEGTSSPVDYLLNFICIFVCCNIYINNCYDMFVCFRGKQSVYKGSAINNGSFGSADIKNKYSEHEKTDTKIENSEKETLLNKELIEMKCMLECILAKMDGHVQGRNSTSGEGMSEVDSSNVNALLRRISHSRH